MCVHVGVFGVNRGHTLACFHTNEDTYDTEDRPRFLDTCNRSFTYIIGPIACTRVGPRLPLI